MLRLFDLAAMATDSGEPCHMQPEEKWFRVRLSVDLTGVKGPPYVLLDLVASVYAKGMGGGPRQLIGQAHDMIKLTDKVTMQIESLGLPSGVYRLEAGVTQSTPNGSTSSSWSHDYVEGWPAPNLLAVRAAGHEWAPRNATVRLLRNSSPHGSARRSILSQLPPMMASMSASA